MPANNTSFRDPVIAHLRIVGVTNARIVRDMLGKGDKNGEVSRDLWRLMKKGYLELAGEKIAVPRKGGGVEMIYQYRLAEKLPTPPEMQDAWSRKVRITPAQNCDGLVAQAIKAMPDFQRAWMGS